MTSEGGLLSRHEAYAKAVKSFYEARIEEERIADAIQKKAMEAGAAVSAKTPSENVQGSSLPCPQTPLTATSRFVAMENAELLDGSEFTRALDEA